MKYQIDVEDDFYDALWSKIIARKIVNQKNVLQQLNKENKSVLLLEQFVRELGPGDKTNREAHAAKVYFNTLMILAMQFFGHLLQKCVLDMD